MKVKKSKRKFVKLGMVFILLLNLMFLFKIWCSKGMYGLPKGDYLYKIESEDCKKEFRLYQCNSILYGKAIRGEIYSKETENCRNIFWSINSESVDVKWEDNNIIYINGENLNTDFSYYFGIE